MERENVKAVRYFGKVCVKHPELSGERYSSCQKCVGCGRNEVRQWRTDPARRLQQNAIARLRQSTPEYLATRRTQYKQWRADPTKRLRDNKDARDRNRQRYRNNPAFAIMRCISARIGSVLRGKKKSARTLVLLGLASIEQYESYLEQQFEAGMTWENYGKAWHIDHRIPLSLGDMSDPAWQRLLLHHTNTRPMWARDNISRGNRLVFEDLL